MAVRGPAPRLGRKKTRIIRASKGVKIERGSDPRKKSSGGGQVAAETSKFVVQIRDTRTGKTTTTTTRSKSSALRTAEAALQQQKQISPQQQAKREAELSGLKVRVVNAKTGQVIKQGKFTFSREGERLRSQELKRQRIEQEKLFEARKAQGITGLLTPNQRTQVYRALANTSYDPLPPKVRQAFREIDNSNLTFLQKEENKRALAGISSGDPRAQGFFQPAPPSVLNEIKPSDFKVTGPKPGILGSLVFAYQQVPRVNTWLEQQRKKAIRGNKNAQASMIGVASLPTNFVESYAGIIIGIALLVKDPVAAYKAIKGLTRKQIDEAGANLGRRVQAGEPGVVTDIAAEIITQRFGLGIIKGAKQVQKLRPSFVKATGDTFVIKKSPFKSVKDFLTKPNNPISKVFRRDPEIILKKQTVSSGASTLSKQARIAGQTVTAVNAAADQLTSWIKRKQIVRKPIPGEDTFPKSIQSLLKKFDSGTKLTKKEFAKVNIWLRKNVAPNITLLERSLYADPASGLRVSRLGISKPKTATFKDILKGNFKLFDRTKPQVLIFQNAKVAKFPKALKNIEAKLKAGKKLTEAETNKLIAWQVETGSGKFKPVGSTIYKGGIELEVTLAPGEFIKRIKQVGFTFIEGKKVTFVTAEVWKPSKGFLDRIKKAKQGKLTDKQVKLLEKDLSKKLGRKINVETPKTKQSKVRRTGADTPVLRLDGKFIRVVRRAATVRRKVSTRAKRITTKRVSTKRAPTTRTTAKSTRAPAPKAKRAPTTRAPSTRKSSPRGTRTTAKSTRAPAPRATGRGLTSRTTRKPIPRLTFDSKLPRGTRLKFDFKYREQGKIKEIKVGLPLNKAIRRAGNLIDKTTARSMELVIVGLTKQKDILKPAVARKFRPKKTKTALRLVEKSKNAIDTRGEKRGLTISKALKQSKKKKAVKVSTKRKKSSLKKSKPTKTSSKSKRKT